MKRDRELLKKFEDNGYGSIEKFFYREVLWGKTKSIIKKAIHRN
mgnify:CR=1 FL=1